MKTAIIIKEWYMGWFYVILIVAVGILFLILVPQLLVKRAIKQVIAIFRNKGATSPETARVLEELGLARKGMFHLGRRDYKPIALDSMVQTGIVIGTELGKYYLSEEKLAGSELSRRFNISPPGSR
jgi:hypothetical protein